MPKLLSRSKHEEFKSNSALQIKDQKERRAKSEEKNGALRNLVPAALFPAPASYEHCSCSPLFSCISCIVVFATIFGFSPFYPCCSHLCLDCMVFHLVCKAT